MQLMVCQDTIKLALLIDNYIETQKLYDKGYDDGLKERLKNKF